MLLASGVRVWFLCDATVVHLFPPCLVGIVCWGSSVALWAAPPPCGVCYIWPCLREYVVYCKPVAMTTVAAIAAHSFCDAT